MYPRVCIYEYLKPKATTSRPNSAVEWSEVERVEVGRIGCLGARVGLHGLAAAVRGLYVAGQPFVSAYCSANDDAAVVCSLASNYLVPSRIKPTLKPVPASLASPVMLLLSLLPLVSMSPVLNATTFPIKRIGVRGFR